MNQDKLKKMQNSVRIGGKGSVRRKVKIVHKKNSTDDKKLQATFKRLGVNEIKGFEEATFFHADGSGTHFTNPKSK
jgi:nascent polypeptide-associated complex subunit beta